MELVSTIRIHFTNFDIYLLRHETENFDIIAEIVIKRREITLP